MKELVRSQFILRAVLSVPPFLLIFFGSDVVASFYNEDIGVMIKILSFIFLASPFRVTMQLIFRVYSDFKPFALISFYEEFFKLLIILLAMLFGSVGAVTVVFATIFAEYLACVLVIPRTVKHLKAFWSHTHSAKLPFYFVLLHHGKWSIVSSYLSQFSNGLRLWMIKFFIGTEAVGLFGVAHGLIQHTASLVPLHTVLSPFIYEAAHDDKKLARIASKGVKYELFSFTALSIVAFILFPPIISFLFPKYIDSLMMYKVGLLYLVPAAFGIIFNRVFVAKKAQLSIAKITIAQLVFMSITLPILLYYFDVMGAMLEFIITAIFIVVERYRNLRRRIPDFRLRLRDLVTFDELDRMLVRSGKAFCLQQFHKYTRFFTARN